MITLAYPGLLVLLLLPLLVRWELPAHREARPSLHVPFLKRLSQLSGQQAGEGASVLEGVLGRKLMMPLMWICLVLAVARPQWIEPPVSRTKPMRDLLVAVDLSGSMETQDFTDASGKISDRLTAVKQVLDGFLAKRESDRVGLVFFGTAAFVQAPFTEDLAACRQLLGEAQVKMAGPQTAFGDAIGLGITMFDRSPMKQKVMIVLTDGNDTSSQVPPPKAAEIAKGKGIVIHTVSVGDPRAAGEQALDVPTLQTVAKETGGVYSAASDRKQLEEIYGKLDALETHAAETVSRRPKRDVHHWPLGIAVGIAFAYFAVLLVWRAMQSREQRASFGKEVPA
jgi:Ca-activated chloride channel family protein